jgi:hypothetical protein
MQGSLGIDHVSIVRAEPLRWDESIFGEDMIRVRVHEKGDEISLEFFLTREQAHFLVRGLNDAADVLIAAEAEEMIAEFSGPEH